ncbi:MAG: shikimate kinase [Gemmatimonadota bacterium]
MSRPLRIVLVGFMGAGKSTVGRILAERLACPFVDLDDEVARLAGRPIPEIFRSEGEPVFRRLEAKATARLDGLDRGVVAAGGGWMARAELRERWSGAIRVWLKVSPAAAIARLGCGVASRPMLDPADPERSARSLLEAREEEYGRAELWVDTEGRGPEEVVQEILSRVRRKGRVPETPEII